ncbi:MAG TPA: preprotein translocase subunit SecA [Anaerolineae bacterium]|nr:preprotein translocase subunit SecA [Anaerolineae bacterium]
MAKGFLKRIFGDPNQRIIARLQKIVQQINALEPEFHALSDEELGAKTAEFRRRLADETLDDLLPEAFAAVREAAQRTIGIRHYDVQLIGGMILHQGEVVEMRTGEGKTLVATLPLYLNALEGRGVHLVTPNDYLAKVGVQWMGPIYHLLGISVSVIQSGAGEPDKASFLYDPTYSSEDDRLQHLRPIKRREAYRADITYGTNNEFGFDYLRDNLVLDLEKCAQSELNFAIVDEVDSILIDEARTPLIISGPSDEPSELYTRFARLAPSLHAETDYEVDVRTQVAVLTDEGAAKVERLLNIPEGESLYDTQHAHMLPYLDNAIRAREFYERDKEYVVQEGEIIIVDEFTGRLMFGRRYSEGLHQAIEAKEGVPVQRESMTHATITFQNFFRMYDKLAGMTGTAATEEEELRKIYNLSVVILPTNVEYRAEFGDLAEKLLPIEQSGVAFAGVSSAEVPYKVTIYEEPGQARFYRRLDTPDQIYKTEEAKFNAVLREIEAAHKAGRPVLVGTTAIETSERLSTMLRRRHIPHNVLNAKYHEQEAVIIAQAGQPGSVTIATNMAGRGVDILLGGNPEGMARDELRKKNVDLTTIRAADWDEALKIARAGGDPTEKYPEQWAATLRDKVRQCQADRERIYQLGGLHVIGTERHEARRIDNQLRGRAGRQGDPGSSRFYISLEDELMRRFGGDRLKPWMERAGYDDAPLEFNVLAKAIESVQQRVEGYNFDVRKHVLEYDNVVNKQREVIYAERGKLLSRADLHDDLFDMVKTEVQQIVTAHTSGKESEWELEALLVELYRLFPVLRSFTLTDLQGLQPEEMVEQIVARGDKFYWDINLRIGEEFYHTLRQNEEVLAQLAEREDPFWQTFIARLDTEMGRSALAEWWELPLRRLPDDLEAQVKAIFLTVVRLYRDRQLMLRQLDTHWMHHLTDLDMLREGIGLRAVGQQNPLVAYQREAFETYQQMLGAIQSEVVRTMFLTPPPPRPTATRQQPTPLLTARRPILHTSGGNVQAEPAKPQPHRGGQKLGRNDPCWCGSGRKYKDCHLKADQKAGLTHYVKDTAGPAH